MNKALRAAIQKTPNTAEGYDTSDIKPIGEWRASYNTNRYRLRQIVLQTEVRTE